MGWLCAPRLTFPPCDLHLYTIRQKDAYPAHVLACNTAMHARTSANRTGKAIINPARTPLTHSHVFLILLLGSQVHRGACDNIHLLFYETFAAPATETQGSPVPYYWGLERFVHRPLLTGQNGKDKCPGMDKETPGLCKGQRCKHVSVGAHYSYWKPS